MLIEGTGNLLEAHVEALVNTINTVGIMGKGVALQFKLAFPRNFAAYQKACEANEVKIGRMFVTYTGMLEPRLIINFPTKTHWKANSRLADIKRGLIDLVRVVREERIGSIAMPPLGCGLGGLRWEEVLPLIEEAFAVHPDVEVLVFPPGAPAPSNHIVRTAKPNLTPWSAALIVIVRTYLELGFEATHQEAQKLLYFLHEAGQPSNATFGKGQYGPCDERMKFGLISMAGHYINGFGDGGRLDPVALVPGALEQAESFLANEPETDGRIKRVVNLIEGFETPYGLELLSTVHWVMKHEGARTEEEVLGASHGWNARKRKSLKSDHLIIARDRLLEQHWI